MRHITRDDVLAYVQGLEQGMRELWTIADAHSLENEDTLSEEFQIAAAVVDIFWSRAREKGNDTGGAL